MHRDNWASEGGRSLQTATRGQHRPTPRWNATSKSKDRDRAPTTYRSSRWSPLMHVLITQPYIPAYRVPLFSRVSELLDQVGVRLTIAAGAPGAIQAKRGDLSTVSGFIPMQERKVLLGQRQIMLRRASFAPKPDLIVSELEALNLFAWDAVLRKRPVVLWGHGKSYVNHPSRIGDRIEWALARRSERVMTYSASGRQYLIERGKLDPSSVVAIGNSTDTVALRSDLLALDAEDFQRTRRLVGTGTRALFVGGLDKSKRIDFLIESAIHARRLDPSFKLIIVGKGELEPIVKTAATNGAPVVHVPVARGRELARLAAVSGAVWMPGRVGLVAVDALAFGLPVHTTDFGFHAPEVEFLEGEEVLYLENDPQSFAENSLNHSVPTFDSGDRGLREEIPTIQSVASAFAKVVTDALAHI
ncbi:glycosyltransferase family 4 protein [Cryobacterium tepidiphilum]|uniref:D-inositol 3-phosphate glycosyltransferase n=1 Tax=Cryobacterium tepidiphilum TaxID=2486026 RepID=A0A3M8LAX6_9MICO|nr:glycosyltransferase family 4 protein [Cryobacterium tepidiphilum]RNE62600.1 glycosyltransferase [Cryobacterium tepidiphilum]